MYYNRLILILPVLFAFCLCEITQGKKQKLLSDFIHYYNHQPNEPQQASEGFLRALEEIDPTIYRVDIGLTVQNNGPKLMQCAATIEDMGDMGITIVNNDMQCGELLQKPSQNAEKVRETNAETETETSPLNPENEVQGDIITSGEQFIPIPRNKPKATCEGCASYVNPQAQGVSDLANLGVRHLDLHEPSMKHSLDSVIDVERQVQVVNGVRYILTMLINFNNCTEVVTDACNFVQTCKVAILVKPWQIRCSRSGGSKYRAILSNNCTDEWQFGDHGEVVPEFPDNLDQKGQSGYPSEDSGNIDVEHDKIIIEHSEGVQSQPHQEKILSIDEIKAIEEQIISNHTETYLGQNEGASELSQNESEEKKDRVIEAESALQNSDSLVLVTEPSKYETNYLSLDKKKAIDDMLDFFKFSGFKSKTETEKFATREKRSYDYEILRERVKRNAILGGQTKRNPNDPKYITLANEAMQKYLESSGNSEPHRVVRIDKVTTQVVAGSLTKMNFIVTPTESANGSTLTCFAEVWEQPWRNKKEINVSCDVGNQRVKRNTRVGGETEKDPNDPKYTSLANEAMQKYLDSSGNSQPHKVIRIDKVTTQVVAGSLTKMNFIVTPTENADGTTLTCFAEVWEQPWRNKKEINVSCDVGNQRVKRNTRVGGETEKDPNDPKYTSLANEAMQKYLDSSGNSQPHRVIRIDKVTTQVVAGSLTKMNFIVTPTENADGTTLTCFAEVWEQPWRSKKEINVTCDARNQRVKRNTRVGSTIERDSNDPMYIRLTHFPGKINEENPSDPKFLLLAEESLKKYVLDNGIQQKLKIIQVDRVTSQFVTGFLTEIEFTVSGMDKSNGVIYCLTEIRDQNGLEQKKINIVCKNDVKLKYNRSNMPVKNYTKYSNKNFEHEEQDVNKPEFKLLASQALLKFSKKNGTLHKVVEIKDVRTRVVAGTIYKMHFIASPTECHFNVSSRRARSCKVIKNTTLYCYSEIWDQPWMRQKRITVRCYNPDIDYDALPEEEEEQTEGRSLNETPAIDTKRLEKLEESRIDSLAEEALEQYLTQSSRKYVYRITQIHNSYGSVDNSTITKIEFSIAPTTCLRRGFTGSINSCTFKLPIVESECNSEINERPSLGEGKEINITCKKKSARLQMTSARRPKRRLDREHIDQQDNYVDQVVQVRHDPRPIQILI